MTPQEVHHLACRISIGLKKSKELFRQSTDAKGGCRMPSQGDACRCFLCLANEELDKMARTIKDTGDRSA